MAEYIDRDAAIAACFDGFADCRDDCAANIRSIPAADVRPVVRSKWKRIDYVVGHDYMCGNCYDKNDRASNFCPCCGADMRPRPKEET